MTRWAWVAACGGASGIMALLAGCPEGGVDFCEGEQCAVMADGSVNDGAGDGAPACDPSKDPSCVNDSSGFFVSPTGDDSNAGTKGSPLKTIGTAVSKTGAAKPNVYICVGTYAEHVKLTTAVNLVGGFGCADWSYAPTNKPKVAPSDEGYALDVESVSSGIAISDLEFDAQAGKDAGASSIAVFVSASSNLTFTRAIMAAVAGVAGKSGSLTSLTFPDQTALNGNNADGGAPGAAKTVDCPADGGATVGGAGGASGINGDPGQPAQSGVDGGGGGVLGACAGPGTGIDGAPANPIPSGKGATKSGDIDGSGWHSSPGIEGSVGGPGQGGGGGFGVGGFGGGGGGAGGCGGAGGGAGGGGGGSIALLVNASTVTLNESTLSTTMAGAGGAGIAGQPGQTPGGFHGNSAGAACVGGNGGAGGAGGAGGGGAGGVSVGVLYKGSAPTIDSATTNAITVAASGGAKGTGGAPGSNDGVVGVAQSVLEIK